MSASGLSVESVEPNLRGTAFAGSFASITQAQVSLIPKRSSWWRRKDYFTEGWRDAFIWRAGVSMHPLDQCAPLSFATINGFHRLPRVSAPSVLCISSGSLA